MDLRPAPISAFARFSDMLKETTKRKPSLHQPITNPSRENESLHSRRASRDERRSSSASYTDKLRHIFVSSSQRNTSINDLPVEVLQHTLLYLDFWTLLQCQCVCKLWRDLVPGDSPLLQEVLYLKPSRDLQIYSCIPTTFDFDFDMTTKSVAIGPQMLGGRLTHGTRKVFTMSRRSTGLIRTSSEIVFHPVIVDFNYYVQQEGFWNLSKGENDGKLAGSWRNMLVSMPPLRELSLRHWQKKNSYCVLTVGEGADGIKLGDLFRVIDEWSTT